MRPASGLIIKIFTPVGKDAAPHDNRSSRSHHQPAHGFTVVPVDVRLMLALTAQCIAVPVHYEVGGKAHDFHVVPLNVKAIDCSGFVRWLLFHITHGLLLLPDGTFIKDRALVLNSFKPIIA